MIKFNELSINPSTNKLIIDVSVLDLPYYENVYIKKIYVHTLNTVDMSNPTSSLDKVIYTSSEYSLKKNVKLSIGSVDRTDGDTSTIDFSSTLCFVIVECSGTPSSDTPCGMDNIYTLGVTFDSSIVYNKMLSYIHELNEDCCNKPYLIDIYLQYKMLQISIETGHYYEAINMFNRLFKTRNNSSSICNCNGRRIV